jgi:[protein-PII] uridylyltransferase
MNPSTRSTIEELAQRRASLVEELPHNPSGLEWCAQHTRICDAVVRVVFEGVCEAVQGVSKIAVVATGGYGRSELAPYSDIDLTVVPGDESDKGIDTFVRSLFTDLHEAFGSMLKLEVGYAFRLVNDAAGLDAQSRTGLLDARRIAGASEPIDRLLEVLWESMPAGQFLLAKIRERNAAFKRYHDTPLVVEPHLKEGAGGLRCFQCANWIRAAIGERPALPTRAYEHVVRFRNLLHAEAGKKQDLLTRQRQAEIADTLGQDLYAMMSALVDSASSLHLEYQRAVDSLAHSRFWVSPGVLAVRGEARVSGDATMSEAAAGVAIATQLGLEVSDLPTLAKDEVNGAEARYAVCSGEATLRNLERCGILMRLLPELARCRVVMPRDASHAFTVYEHTIRVVRALASLAPGSFLGDLMDGLHDPQPLLLAALLHDVGKIDESRPHAETGEAIAREVCARWEVADDDTETVAWLVGQHLLMSLFLRMRDIQNPQTALEFAAHVKDRERLDMLTLLTWADTRSVGEGVWTPAQEHMLEELHARVVQVLDGDAPSAPDPAMYRRRLLRELRHEDIPESEVKEFVESLPAHYLISTPPEVVRLHIGFERRARAGESIVSFHHEPELGSTELTVCAPDAAGLLSKVLGVLYAFDVSLHGIRASTTRTDKPVAVDQFATSFGERPIPPGTCRELAVSLKRVIEGEEDVSELLRRRGKDPERLQRSFTFTYLPGTPGIMEVRAPRGKGMAYRFCNLITKAGWNIVSARVGQWAGRGAAAFYILGPEDRELSREEVEAVVGRQV